MKFARFTVFLLLGLLLGLPIMVMQSVRETDQMVKKTLEIWEPELSDALVKDRMFLVDRIGRSLMTETTDRIQISRQGRDYFSIPALTESAGCSLRHEYPISLYGARVGTLTHCYSMTKIVTVAMRTPFFWAFVFGALFTIMAIQLLSLRGYRHSVIRTLTFLKHWAKASDQQNNPPIGPTDRVTSELINLIREGTSARLELEKAKAEIDKSEMQFKLAAQVAHDIRSPLAALENVVGNITALPEDERILVRTAVNRIKDIANNLIERHREMKSAARLHGQAPPEGRVALGENSSVQLLSSLLDPLITEKRMQFRSRIDIVIDGRVDASSYGLFAKVQPTEFSRVISNLVNNAVEALDGGGTVTVALTGNKERVEIQVADNGKGIPPEVVRSIGQRGVTHGKSGGSGLGLYHAKTSVERWGGELSFNTYRGKGTTVTVVLPRVLPPDWFVSELRITSNSTIVILDDDSSIHGIWQGRLDAIRSREHGISILHFSTPEDLIRWVDGNGIAAKSAMYLADYELLGHQETGLDLIENLRLGQQSVLVTSRFEEQCVRDGCERLKVRLIPKSMASYVPIKLEQPLEKPDYVLLDDDDITHMAWRYAARKDGKVIMHFYRPEDLFSYLPKLHKKTPLYIDSVLGSGIKGQDIAKQIVGLGFTEIWLCTGMPPENFKDFSFLRGCVSKDAPWLPISHNW